MSRSAQRRELARRRAIVRRRWIIAGALAVIVIVAGLLWWMSTSNRPTVVMTADDVQRIDVAQARTQAESGQAIIYDTRSRASYEIEHAEGAVAFPEDELEQNLSSLSEDKKLIFYCT
ncbi:MAG: rhodanese-like domain-containing protein [Anaerolineae bacterium]